MPYSNPTDVGSSVARGSLACSTSFAPIQRPQPVIQTPDRGMVPALSIRKPHSKGVVRDAVVQEHDIVAVVAAVGLSVADVRTMGTPEATKRLDELVFELVFG